MKKNPTVKKPAPVELQLHPAEVLAKLADMVAREFLADDFVDADDLSAMMRRTQAQPDARVHAWAAIRHVLYGTPAPAAVAARLVNTTCAQVLDLLAKAQQLAAGAKMQLAA